MEAFVYKEFPIILTFQHPQQLLMFPAFPHLQHTTLQILLPVQWCLLLPLPVIWLIYFTSSTKGGPPQGYGIYCGLDSMSGHSQHFYFTSSRKGGSPQGYGIYCGLDSMSGHSQHYFLQTLGRPLPMFIIIWMPQWLMLLLTPTNKWAYMTT